MEVLVRNAEGNVSKRDREYAAKKLGRLDRYFHTAQKVEMVHREQGLTHRIEITVFADGFTIRGEERDFTVQAAIDRVSEKLESRLRKLKGRIISTHRRKGQAPPPALMKDAKPHSNGHCEVAERKVFLVKPMSLDEAALQLEMLGHPFFVFKNEDTNQVAVLYRRKDKRYGLLEPEV
jgi:putative sigma-54 modulation protein